MVIINIYIKYFFYVNIISRLIWNTLEIKAFLVTSGRQACLVPRTGFPQEKDKYRKMTAMKLLLITTHHFKMAIKILSKYIIHQATIYRNVNYLKSTQIFQQMVFWPPCHIFPDPIISTDCKWLSLKVEKLRALISIIKLSWANNWKWL